MSDFLADVSTAVYPFLLGVGIFSAMLLGWFVLALLVDGIALAVLWTNDVIDEMVARLFNRQ